MARVAGRHWNRDTCTDKLPSETLFRYAFPFFQPLQFPCQRLESLTSTLDDVPNKHVSPFDAALPGTLPVGIG